MQLFGESLAKFGKPAPLLSSLLRRGQENANHAALIAAKKSITSKDLLAQLDAHGVTVRVHSKNLLPEEAPQAYKDAQQVVNVVHNAGLAKLVARLNPVIVVKG